MHQRLAWRVTAYGACLLADVGMHPGLQAADRPARNDVHETQPLRTHAPKRPATMKDVIEMTRLADPEYLGGGSSSGRVAQYSPDETKFVVVLRKGHLESNSNEYFLVLWQTREVYRSPKPRVLLRLTSTSNRPAIRSVSWEKDNETLLFLGEGPGELQQVYGFNCRTRRLTKITNSQTNVLSYSTGGVEWLAYTAEALPDRSKNRTWERMGRPVSVELITEVLTGRADEQWSDHVRVVVQNRLMRKAASTIAERLLMPFPFPEDRPLVSPDGNYVLLLANVERIPASWLDFTDPKMRKWTRWKTGPGQFAMLRRYILLNRRTKQQKVLLDAPISLNGGASSEAVWMPDGQSLVITNTYLPLEGVSKGERDARLAGAFVVEVKVPSLEVAKVSSRDLRLIKLEDRTNELIFKEGRSNSTVHGVAKVYFRKLGAVWENVPTTQDATEPPDIVLEEGMNLAPRIVAIQRDDQKRTLLLDLNPEFEELEFGREERIRWKAKDGHEVEGGLYYPVDYFPGRRYPLVIQTHGFRPERFDIDGPYTSAFAAQPLAGKGIMVLQAERADPSEVVKHLATTTEAEWRVSAYEGAIDYLDSRGMIDRARVGIMGFSRTCWYVKYALTHSNFPYAAASTSDGIDMGYFGYVAMANRAYPGNEMDQIMGAAPTGAGKERWMKQSPGFNIDKVSGAIPLRIVASYPLDLFVEWEWFSMMKRLGKPVDMVVFLDGVHLLEKPLNRMVSQDGNVDWFDFWLNGREDQDPAKAEQYERWRKLREMTKDQGDGTQ